MLLFLAVLFCSNLFAQCASARQSVLVAGVPSCGHISSFEKTEYIIYIGHQITEAEFILRWSGERGSVDLTIRSPDGTQVEPDLILKGRQSLSYMVSTPEPGRWNIGLAAGDLAGGGVEYCLEVSLKNPNTQAANAAKFDGFYHDQAVDDNNDGLYDRITIAVGLQVMRAGYYNLVGHLYDTRTGENITAENGTYLKAGSRFMYLDLYDLRSPGPYVIKELQLYDEAGEMVASEKDSYTTNPYDINKTDIRSARLNGIYRDYGSDINNDGFYDYLTIDVGLDVSDPGNYTLIGYLCDPDGSSAIWSVGSEEVDAGENIIHMDFDGKSIWMGGYNGTYHLRELSLLKGDSERENLSIQEFLLDAYETSSYNYTEFVDPEWPPRILSGFGRGEALLTILIRTVLPVFNGRYSCDLVGINIPPLSSNFTVEEGGIKEGYGYHLPGIYIPGKPNNFTVSAKGVKSMNIGLKKDPVPGGSNRTRMWVSSRAYAVNGTATLDNDQISPGRYHIKIFGDAAENTSDVTIEMRLIKKVIINGNFSININMSRFPSGNYTFDMKALNGSLELTEVTLECPI